MKFIPVQSLHDIERQGINNYHVLFYRRGSSHSDCAYEHLEAVEDASVFSVDVNDVRDIHPHYGVDSVPSLVVVKDGDVKNLIKGCQSTGFYHKILHEEGVKPVNGQPEKKQKRVTVYSTPTCTYCNKLKQYFNKHGIRYTDINVAADMNAAKEMVRRSGQQGVPQTDIDGQIIIGFDSAKISKLLNIPTE